MPPISLKPSYKVVREYYRQVRAMEGLGASHEGAVAPAFAELLRYAAREGEWELVEQFSMRQRGRSIRVDGALLDPFKLVRGVWEAKDGADDLAREVQRKRAAGYPLDNTLFQAPTRVILFQSLFGKPQAGAKRRIMRRIMAR